MFPLIAISAFFILGIAFFVIGKDDFGLKGVKGDPSNNSTKKNEIVNPELNTKLESNEEKEIVNSEPISERESIDNASD
tara:strand:- start:2087 stop:2323 length:237 start_codon:yes stop_codon:yes gene_type:complete